MAEEVTKAGEKLKAVEGNENPTSGIAAHFGGFSTSSKPQYVEEAKSSYATQREQDGIARRKGREGREKRMFEKLLKQVCSNPVAAYRGAGRDGIHT